MDWLTSLRDQLPLLLVLSPIIGAVGTGAAAFTQKDLIRYFAVTNVICSLLILAGIAWQFRQDGSEARTAIRLAMQSAEDEKSAANAVDAVHVQLERQRVDRTRYQWFTVDGINLWPTLILIIVTGLVVWSGDPATRERHSYSEPIFRREQTGCAGPSCDARKPPAAAGGVPAVLLFQSAAMATLTACDLRAFLLASATSAVLMSGLVGCYGGPDRRNLSERFLFAQLLGISLIALAFAMLVVAMPWMKMEDSPTIPNLSWNLVTLVYEIQKWTGRNPLSFHYQNVVFPWMLFLLSLGFAFQFGLFPFHSWQVSLLGQTPSDIAVLCLAGSISVASTGWLRFVVPLAPELLASFDRLILISALGAAIWGSLRAFGPDDPRQKTAMIFCSLSGVSLLGCYCFTTTGMCGAWLMQQQVVLALCATRLLKHTENLRDMAGRETPSVESGFTTRTLLLLLSLPLMGLFAASSLIFSELLRENLLILACILVVVGLVSLTILSLMNRHYHDELRVESGASKAGHDGASLITIALLAVVVNLFPQWMLYQCEPEFDRVFRRFERPAVASSEKPSAVIAEVHKQ